MLDASPPIIVLSFVALVCCVWAWRRSIAESNARREIIDWVRTNHARLWANLPASDRFMGMPTLIRLMREGRLDDPEFRRRAEALQQMPSVLPPLLMGMAAIGLLLLGSHLFGWRS
ncbi:MAG: hypothetical protein GY791_11965 [Alphaproteobacteria bacterium]|nr:hypothetical protein [Alphaproteobacteria bacterium]